MVIEAASPSEGCPKAFRAFAIRKESAVRVLLGEAVDKAIPIQRSGLAEIAEQSGRRP